MFDCCTNNRCDCGPYCNRCPPTNFCCRQSCTTEFPKQKGPHVELKFSNYFPPSFLCRSDSSKATVKKRSCSCSTKYPKVSSICKCKSKGITDCRQLGKDSKRVCEETCAADASAKNMPGAGPGATPLGTLSDNTARTIGQGSTNAILQGPDGSSRPVTRSNSPVNGGNPEIPVYNIPGQRNQPTNRVPGMNQGPQNLNQMPAAGLPTRQIPPFDPCTGRECFEPLQQAPFGPYGVSGMPMNCMCPCFCPMQCYPCPCPCPQMQEPNGSTMPTNLNQDEQNMDNDDGNVNFRSRSTSNEGSENSASKRDKSQPLETAKSSAKEKESAKTGELGEKDKSATNLINCSNASPELIERICETLKLANPPENCYILLPIDMASHHSSKHSSKQSSKHSSRTKLRDESAESKKGKAQDAKKKNLESEATNSKDPKPAQEQKDKRRASSEPKTTRNCGCNTLITGNRYQESSDKSEGYPTQNCCSNGACCNSGCYYRPRYAYCYNPCTGCFYWRKKCCCCNCCNNGCCNNGGNCPISKPGSRSVPDDSTVAKKKGLDKNSQSNGRFTAGAMPTFQPGVEELYNQWVGFQQHAVFPPMMSPQHAQQHATFVSSGPIYFRSTRFYPSPFQMNGTRINPQSPPQSPASEPTPDEPNYRIPDIDWTPQ